MRNRTFACLLAARGVDVLAVDPATASLVVARAKPGADRVQWLEGEVTDVKAWPFDVAFMTANVAQVFVEDDHWAATLHAIGQRLAPKGRLVLETRDPAHKAWLEWNRADSYSKCDIAGVGLVESWVDLVCVTDGIVSFRWTFVFASDGAVLTSDSTLRFRERDEVARSLSDAGFVVDEVRDAPDRPGRELVFVATLRTQASAPTRTGLSASATTTSPRCSSTPGAPARACAARWGSEVSIKPLPA